MNRLDTLFTGCNIWFSPSVDAEPWLRNKPSQTPGFPKNCDVCAQGAGRSRTPCRRSSTWPGGSIHRALEPTPSWALVFFPPVLCGLGSPFGRSHLEVGRDTPGGVGSGRNGSWSHSSWHPKQSPAGLRTGRSPPPEVCCGPVERLLALPTRPPERPYFCLDTKSQTG